MTRALLPTALALVLAPAAHAGFRASSFASTRGSTEFAAQAALDSDPATPWMTHAEADVVGSWFELDLPKGTLDKLSLVVGYDRDDESFGDYARVTTVKVELFDEAGDGVVPTLQQTVSFEDRRGWQTVELPDTAFGSELFGGRVRLTVVEAAEGRDYPNLAVGEILVHLAESDCPIQLLDPPASAHEAHPAAALVDGDERSFWSAGPNGTGNRVRVGASGWGVSSVGIVPGPATHARPKRIAIRANDVTRTVDLAENARGAQWFPVPPLTGYTGSGFGEVSLEVLETWPGSREAELAIAEIKLRATTYEGL